jgi:DNA polymerase V
MVLRSDNVQTILAVKQTSTIKIPLFNESVKAGFPSPADDFIDKHIDLNELLIRHPAATFFVRVKGDSMVNAGIFSGDVLVVDKALEAKNNCIVIAVINGELTVKRLRKTGERVQLVPENDNYSIIEIDSEMSFQIWGVVKSVIRELH